MGAAIGIGALCVLAVNLYAGALIVYRAKHYRTTLYRPMLLNIVLSNVPIVLAVAGFGVILLSRALVLNDIASPWVGGVTAWGSAALFVAFFPNSAYLITELNFSHREEGDGVPLWFDIVMTLTLTMSGILNAIVSLALVQTFLIFAFGQEGFEIPSSAPLWTWGVSAGVLLLGCLGVWLGRMVRLNSWDVVLPWRVAVKVVRKLREKGAFGELVGFTVTHWLLLALLYTAVYAPVSMLVFGELRAQR